MIYSFNNDYSESANTQVLEELAKLSSNQYTGYGLDQLSLDVENQLRILTKNDKIAVHLLPGGTMVNITFLASALKPHEAVIAAETAHINVHETGAIEATGHKIYTIKTKDGKLRAKDVESAVLHHVDEHMVKPKVVFISNTTEVGTVYSKDELKSLRNICDKYNLYLYLDGARLSNALVIKEANLTLEDCSKLTDAFYLGGTKNGILFGEALVINNPDIEQEFRWIIKQRGGLIAKGFILGAQFKALLSNDLYLKNANYANNVAQYLQKGLVELGYEMAYDSPSNQIFPILDDSLIEKLKEDFDFIVMDEFPNKKHMVRLVCSWNTPKKTVDAFIDKIKSIK